MKLKFTYTPRQDANGYFLRLPNGNEKRFKTKKVFERWFLFASNELNGVFKILLIQYPYLSELYSELYIRSNVHNYNRLAFIQKIHNEINIISGIFGIIPKRGFYEAYTDLYRLLSFYRGLYSIYHDEFTIFSDRFVLNKLRMLRQLLELQQNKLDEL
nr:hypothetical protein [uncultured Draconibacterium sp.]